MVNGASLPRYIGRGGEQVALPPYTAYYVRLYGFILRAQRAALDNMLNMYLNEPSGGRLSFRTPYPLVLFYFAELGELRSAAATDRGLGGSFEQEVAFMILAQDTNLDVLHAFCPYMFVDSSPAMASGRELYGFPKQFAEIAMDDDEFRLDLTGLRRYASDGFAVKERLIRIQADQPLLVPPALQWTSIANAQDGLTSLASDGAVTEDGDSIPPNILSSLFGFFVDSNVRMVFLKQFRDILYPERACYQAVTECSASLLQFHAGAVYPRDHGITVTIDDLDSHPILRELGLNPRDQPERATGSGPVHFQPPVSVWLAFDFQLEIGQELWRAGQPSPAAAADSGG